MTIDLEKLRRLAQVATPGLWVNDADGCVGKTYIEGGKTTVCTCPLLDMKKNGKNDAAFIAEANPVTVLELLDEIERLHGLLEEAVAEIGVLSDFNNAKMERLRTELEKES